MAAKRKVANDMSAEERTIAEENLALFLSLRLPEEHRGGRPVAVPAALAQRLHAACLDAFARGERSGNRGGLHVVHGGAEHVFWGFETYVHVQAALAKEGWS